MLERERADRKKLVELLDELLAENEEPIE